MKSTFITGLTLVALMALPTLASAKQWTLTECLDYADKHNISVQKSLITQESGQEDLKQAKAALWPSLSANVNQSVNYRPFPETYIDQSGLQYSQTKKSTYGGQYGVNANWTVFNGGVNIKNIEAQKVQNELNELSTEKSRLALQEQIAQLYVQIMYCQEARKVNESLLETAEKQLSRGQQMKAQGQMSVADVAQLEAQVASCKYNVVNSETQVSNYKRQLKALLQLDLNDDFDVTGQVPADERALEAIPSAQEVYAYAMENRPEMRSAQLNREAADINLQIAKRSFSPTVGLSASLGDSHNSNGSGNQMKTNLNMSAGVTVSIPLWQQRRNITNLNKAKLQKVSSQLDFDETRNTMSSTIEQYWLNATNNQQNFVAADARVKSQEVSYKLLNEQYNNGLKNIVELLEARDNLINAQQTKLQAKYNTLLNAELLKLYNGQSLNL